MSLVKLKIVGYSDNKYSSEAGSFDVQINPSSMKLNKGINYAESKDMSEQEKQKFDMQQANSLSFDITLDDTGIVPNNKGKIKDRINVIEKVLYTINGETHEPNYAKVVWGDFVFQGRLTSLNYDYTLFKPDGSPLRVKISFSFKGYKSGPEKKSPDLSRNITLKSGENIALLCQKFYDDPSYCTDVAKANDLVNFRNIKPGTQLMFPPLKREK